MKPKRRDNPEQRFHIAAAKYLAWALRPPTWWTTFPAGGGGSARGAFLKAMGLKAGVPDILIFHPVGDATRVVAPELKAARGRLSPGQLETICAMGDANVSGGPCHSIEDLAALIQRAGIPLFAKPWGAGYATTKPIR